MPTDNELTSCHSWRQTSASTLIIRAIPFNLGPLKQEMGVQCDNLLIR